MNYHITDNNLPLKLAAPFEIKEALRRRAKQRRLEANLTQQGLSRRANVSFGTLKRFEKTGDASVEFLLAVAFALGAEREFDELFPPRPYKTIDDIIDRKQRLRGRRK